MKSKLTVITSVFCYVMALSPAYAQNNHQIMFDDFTYKNFQQAKEHGWQSRTDTGHPGIKHATWWEEGISFHPDPLNYDNYVMRLTSKTDGTAENTRHTQICHRRKYREGTYAARVYFNDQPQYGPDGDGVVQTFYAISPLVAPMDKNYSEMDFEYLPNGGWGEQRHALFATSWETFQLTPWTKENQYDASINSLQGWNLLVLNAAGNTLRYYINGVLFAKHGPDVFPEVPMSINFNLWFIQEQLLADRSMRQYYQDVDWVYFSENQGLTTQQVETHVAALRKRNIAQHDSIPDWSPKQADYCSL